VTLAVVVLVLAALAMRLWGIGFGLPHIYHTDEVNEVKRALMLGAGVFNLGRAFKGGLYYLLFVEYAVYFAVLRALGVVHSSFDFLVRYFSEPTGFWLIGRVTVALLGAANGGALPHLRDRPRRVLAFHHRGRADAGVLGPGVDRGRRRDP